MNASLKFALCLLGVPSLHAATVVTSVAPMGFDAGGNALTAVLNGQDVYNGQGVFCGTWTVVTDQYTVTTTSGVTGGGGGAGGTGASLDTYPDDMAETTILSLNRGVVLTSFNALADAGDFVMITGEDLDMSITEEFRDVRFRRRDGVAGPYDHTFNASYNSVLGSNTVSGEAFTTNIGSSWTVDGYTHTAATGTSYEVVTTGAWTGGVTPTATLELINGTSGGIYNGTNLSLFMQRQLASTIDLAVDQPDGGSLPQIQYRGDLTFSGDYTLDFERFSFSGDLDHVNTGTIPEPSRVLMLGMAVAVMALRRRR